MNQQFFLILSVFAVALMSCASTKPLESPKSVKKEVVAKSKPAVKKAVKKSTPKKKVPKKAVKKKTVRKKTPSKSSSSKIKAPTTATQKPTSPVIDAPAPKAPVVKKPAPPVVKKPIKLRTATPVLGRDGYVHNPFSFDEHIDVRGTPSGSVVTPDGNPEHKFKVP